MLFCARFVRLLLNIFGRLYFVSLPFVPTPCFSRLRVWFCFFFCVARLCSVCFLRVCLFGCFLVFLMFLVNVFCLGCSVVFVCSFVVCSLRVSFMLVYVSCFCCFVLVFYLCTFPPSVVCFVVRLCGCFISVRCVCCCRFCCFRLSCCVVFSVVC